MEHIIFMIGFKKYTHINDFGMVKWLFNVTINDISVIYVTAHRCAGGNGNGKLVV